MRIGRDRRGAVLAEFAVAAVPVFITFFSFVQVAKAYTAGLVMQHAATVAARYAIVAQGPCIPGGSGDDDATAHPPAEAARAAIGPWASNVDVLDVKTSYAASDPYGDVKTTATFAYRCDIPLGGRIVCPGGSLTKTVELTLPHQGARYDHACR